MLRQLILASIAAHTDMYTDTPSVFSQKASPSWNIKLSLQKLQLLFNALQAYWWQMTSYLMVVMSAGIKKNRVLRNTVLQRKTNKQKAIHLSRQNDINVFNSNWDPVKSKGEMLAASVRLWRSGFSSQLCNSLSEEFSAYVCRGNYDISLLATYPHRSSDQKLHTELSFTIQSG